MIFFRCACLIEIQKNKLLLVRVRKNKKWYFPGGKIESGEDPKQALARELYEELSIKLDIKNTRYLTTIKSDAYPQNGKIELICFSGTWKNEISASSEITEVSFIDWTRRDLFAPAVNQFCEEWLTKYFDGEIKNVL